MTIFLSIFAILLVVLGFFGIAIPALPDLPLMLAGLLLRSVATDFHHPAINELVVATVAVGFVGLIDAFAAPLVAKRFGAASRGQWGALIGGLCSFLLIPISPWFILILPIIGTIIGELSSGRTHKEAIKSSLGVTLGIGVMLVFKVIVGFGLLGTLIVSFFRG